MGRDKAYPLSDELIGNVNTIVPRVNDLLERFGEKREVSSGYRPPAINKKTPNAAKKSNHMLCLACDLEDPDGKLDEWCLANLDVLEEIGLWLESPKYTPNWVHVQCVPPRSKKRVFIP